MDPLGVGPRNKEEFDFPSVSELFSCSVSSTEVLKFCEGTSVLGSGSHYLQINLSIQISLHSYCSGLGFQILGFRA